MVPWNRGDAARISCGDGDEVTLETLLWGIYPVWLLAGAGDYLCHRRTDIEHTSGSGESWYHLWQFFTLLVVIAVGTLLEPNALGFGIMVVAVIVHSVLAHMDVSYTEGRRYISPFEQLIHGFMGVLPLVAVAIFGVMYWQEIRAGLLDSMFTLAQPDPSRIGLLASFVVLAGVPIVEELLRTRRYRAERRRYQAGLATIK